MNNVYLYIVSHSQEKGKENVRAQILKFYFIIHGTVQGSNTCTVFSFSSHLIGVFPKRRQPQTLPPVPFRYVCPHTFINSYNLRFKEVVFHEP